MCRGCCSVRMQGPLSAFHALDVVVDLMRSAVLPRGRRCADLTTLIVVARFTSFFPSFSSLRVSGSLAPFVSSSFLSYSPVSSSRPSFSRRVRRCYCRAVAVAGSYDGSACVWAARSPFPALLLLLRGYSFPFCQRGSVDVVVWRCVVLVSRDLEFDFPACGGE